MTCSCWLEAVHNRVQGYPSHDKQTANSGISSAAWEVANLGLVRPPGISGFTHLRGVDPSRSAIAISSENACRATWSSARRHGHRAVLSLGCEIPGSRHSRALPKAHTVTVRATVSFWPEPELSGILDLPAQLGLCGVRAPLALSRPTCGWSEPVHEGRSQHRTLVAAAAHPLGRKAMYSPGVTPNALLKQRFKWL